jgi:hypothetical protein
VSQLTHKRKSVFEVRQRYGNRGDGVWTPPFNRTEDCGLLRLFNPVREISTAEAETFGCVRRQLLFPVVLPHQ